jgi:hypothetical protein
VTESWRDARPGGEGALRGRIHWVDLMATSAPPCGVRGTASLRPGPERACSSCSTTRTVVGTLLHSWRRPPSRAATLPHPWPRGRSLRVQRALRPRQRRERRLVSGLATSGTARCSATSSARSGGKALLS